MVKDHPVAVGVAKIVDALKKALLKFRSGGERSSSGCWGVRTNVTYVILRFDFFRVV